MDLRERIKLATCRVDLENSQGSAFFVDETQLISAAHVTSRANNDTVTLYTPVGREITSTVEAQDVNHRDDLGSDLALLRTTEKPEGCTAMDLSSDIPSIGTEMVWSGYARLLGEDRLDRQRFGWGNIASTTYGEHGTFFEVDGLFNPSHSGGPVIATESEDVVGVVSASAGEFEELEESWGNLVQRMVTLFQRYNQINTQGGMYRGFTIDDPAMAIQGEQELRQLGLRQVETEQTDDGMQLRFKPNEIPVRIAEIQADLADLLLTTAQETFQMGVGIATGGDELVNLIR